jgi:hypothetical protein
LEVVQGAVWLAAIFRKPKFPLAIPNIVTSSPALTRVEDKKRHFLTEARRGFGTNGHRAGEMVTTGASARVTRLAPRAPGGNGLSTKAKHLHRRAHSPAHAREKPAAVDAPPPRAEAEKQLDDAAAAEQLEHRHELARVEVPPPALARWTLAIRGYGASMPDFARVVAELLETGHVISYASLVDERGHVVSDLVLN